MNKKKSIKIKNKLKNNKSKCSSNEIVDIESNKCIKIDSRKANKIINEITKCDNLKKINKKTDKCKKYLRFYFPKKPRIKQLALIFLFITILYLSIHKRLQNFIFAKILGLINLKPEEIYLLKDYIDYVHSYQDSIKNKLYNINGMYNSIYNSIYNTISSSNDKSKETNNNNKYIKNLSPSPGKLPGSFPEISSEDIHSEFNKQIKDIKEKPNSFNPLPITSISSLKGYLSSILPFATNNKENKLSNSEEDLLKFYTPLVSPSTSFKDLSKLD